MKKEIKKEINQTLKKLNYTDSDININISIIITLNLIKFLYILRDKFFCMFILYNG